MQDVYSSWRVKQKIAVDVAHAKYLI